MTSFRKLIPVVCLGISLTTSVSFADIIKGQKIYTKKLKPSCGINGGRFAAKHTQEEWDKIYNMGKMSDEISKICHGVKLENSLIKHVHDFVKKYASDSGNVPAC
ncbi:MAG: cytochrome C [Epsilonproteobacteria bacterium]|nr:cytochrome C [Campylobacterota bacterium]